MIRKRCAECKRAGWFWERKWHLESQAEADRRSQREAKESEERRARLASKYPELGLGFTGGLIGSYLSSLPELYCPSCAAQKGYGVATAQARGREAAKQLNDQQDFLGAMEADPTWAIPFFNQGQEYLRRGNAAEARRCFEKAHSLAKPRQNAGDDLVLSQVRAFCPDLG